MVTHDQTAELKSGPTEMLGLVIPQLHLHVSVFQIGIIRPGTNVTPLAQHGIPEETVMCFIRIGNHHDVIDLSPAFAIRA